MSASNFNSPPGSTQPLPGQPIEPLTEKRDDEAGPSHSPLVAHRLSAFGRNSRGGVLTCVVLEPAPLSSSQRLNITRHLGALTAFVPAIISEQFQAIVFDPGTGMPEGAVPTVFFDIQGERPDGEQAYIGVFRALAVSGMTLARRVLLETSLGLVAVQEEVFRKSPNAQVWIEQPLPPLEALAPGDPLGLSAVELERLNLSPDAQQSGDAQQAANLQWICPGPTGTVLLVKGAGLEAVRAATLAPEQIKDAVPSDISDLVVFTTESSSPFSDIFVRHVSLRGDGEERAASVAVNAMLGVLLWQHPQAEGLPKTHLLIEQGESTGQSCRISVWLEADSGDITRVSVGGPIVHLERLELDLSPHIQQDAVGGASDS